MEGNLNLGILFFSWWYTEAFFRLFTYLKKFFLYVFDLFSVKLCFLTMFSPWKRDTIGYEGLSLQQRFSVWTLNLASRLVGAIIKFFTIITFLVAFAVVLVLSLLLIIVWFLYPAIIIFLFIYSFKTIFS